MSPESLGIAGAWLLNVPRFADSRGWFSEAFSHSLIDGLERNPFAVAQINTSLSFEGVIRGIHYSLAAEGQAKYVQCLVGRILDVAVDLRPDSPMLGNHVAVELSMDSPQAVLLGAGLGHAFQVLEGPALVMYATSSRYRPEHEATISPFDPELAIEWRSEPSAILSDRDKVAMSFTHALNSARLPSGNLG